MRCKSQKDNLSKLKPEKGIYSKCSRDLQKSFGSWRTRLGKEPQMMVAPGSLKMRSTSCRDGMVGTSLQDASTIGEGARLTAGCRTPPRAGKCFYPSASLFMTCSRLDQTQAGPSDGLSLHHMATVSCLQGQSRPKWEVRAVGQARGSHSKTGRPECVCQLREESQ